MMTCPIKPGTARRLGIDRPEIPEPLVWPPMSPPDMTQVRLNVEAFIGAVGRALRPQQVPPAE